MIKYEYKTVALAGKWGSKASTADVDKALAKESTDGWRLVPIFVQSLAFPTLIFERELEHDPRDNGLGH